MQKLFLLFIFSVLLLGSLPVYAQKGQKRYGNKTPGRSVSSIDGQKKAIEVRGQTRTLSMGLVLKNKKEQIDFIQPRTNYDEEIKATTY